MRTAINGFYLCVALWIKELKWFISLAKTRLLYQFSRNRYRAVDGIRQSIWCPYLGITGQPRLVKEWLSHCSLMLIKSFLKAVHWCCWNNPFGHPVLRYHHSVCKEIHPNVTLYHSTSLHIASQQESIVDERIQQTSHLLDCHQILDSFSIAQNHHQLQTLQIILFPKI